MPGSIRGHMLLVAALFCTTLARAEADTDLRKLETLRGFLSKRNAQDYAVVGPNAIDEGKYVTIGGIEQWITIRGEDRKNPVLLFLHGGPGDATNPWGYAGFRTWLKQFTVVQWDQRGSGRTLGKNGPTIAPTITIDRLVEDGIELVEVLRKSLQKDRIVLVGHSWGSILGVRMAKARPDLFVALVGTGQVADPQKNYAVAYQALRDGRSHQAPGRGLRACRQRHRRAPALHRVRREEGQHASVAGLLSCSGFRPSRACPIALIAPRHIEGRQPALPPAHPHLVGGRHLARRIEAPGRNLDLVASAAEHGGAASRAEITPGIIGSLAGDRHRFGREDRKGVEHRAVMLSAIQTMADADAARFSAALQPYRPAEAASGIVGFAHVYSPDWNDLPLQRRSHRLGSGSCSAQAYFTSVMKPKSIPVLVPPLRNRREDIPHLVEHFVEKYACRIGKRIDGVAPAAMQALTEYQWPGNVRELEYFIERSVILSRGGELEPPRAEAAQAGGRPMAVRDGSGAAPLTRKDAEREHVLRTLKETQWIIGGRDGAAARLGMKRTTLQSLVKRMGIERPSSEAGGDPLTQYDGGPGSPRRAGVR